MVCPSEGRLGECPKCFQGSNASRVLICSAEGHEGMATSVVVEWCVKVGKIRNNANAHLWGASSPCLGMRPRELQVLREERRMWDPTEMPSLAAAKCD